MLPVVFERVALAVLEAIFTTEPAAKLEVVPAVPLIVIAPVADAVKLPPAVLEIVPLRAAAPAFAVAEKKPGEESVVVPEQVIAVPVIVIFPVPPDTLRFEPAGMVNPVPAVT